MPPGSSGQRCPGYQHNVEDLACETGESGTPRHEKSYSLVCEEPCEQCAVQIAYGIACMNHWLHHSGVTS